ncbi:MAG: hypothetical protein KAS75_07365 [Planctomycetes bacterium]|nr:hypothetical protein [Planctomycetota bacterium]
MVARSVCGITSEHYAVSIVRVRLVCYQGAWPAIVAQLASAAVAVI